MVFWNWNIGTGKFLFPIAVLNSIVNFVPQMTFENFGNFVYGICVCVVSVYLSL